jgi:hypothetical protein
MTDPVAAQAAVSPNQDYQQGISSDRASDMSIAKAVSQAVRNMPGVVDLSHGQGAVAATYGPGGRVIGVVVQHPSPQEISLEVHVVLHGSLYTETFGNASDTRTQAGTSGTAVLIDAADRIRSAVSHATQELKIAPPLAVDVLIEDIQFPA